MLLMHTAVFNDRGGIILKNASQMEVVCQQIDHCHTVNAVEQDTFKNLSRSVARPKSGLMSQIEAF